MDDKIVTRTNLDDRNDVIRTIGREEFYSNEEAYGEYWDVTPPSCFLWIFGVFRELYVSCGDRIGFQDICAWEHAYGIRLTTYELDLLQAMGSWAADEIAELREDAEE